MTPNVLLFNTTGHMLFYWVVETILSLRFEGSSFFWFHCGYRTLYLEKKEKKSKTVGIRGPGKGELNINRKQVFTICFNLAGFLTTWNVLWERINEEMLYTWLNQEDKMNIDKKQVFTISQHNYARSSFTTKKWIWKKQTSKEMIMGEISTDEILIRISY